MAPTAETTTQRFQLALAGLVFNVRTPHELTGEAPMLAKPSRLKVTYVTTGEIDVSWSVSGFCQRSTGPSLVFAQVWLLLKSTNTIQPLVQLLLAVQAVPVPFVGQMVTNSPCFCASLRANCRSPNSALVSEEMRFAAVKYLNDDVPIAAKMPAIMITISSSNRVKPVERVLFVILFMAARLRQQPCLKLAARGEAL
jgi:hypothetical protein